MTHTNHCSACGAENPATDEGYTACCNKALCHGLTHHRYGTEADHVEACCWGVAEVAFSGREIPADAKQF